jgi:hypothetical protein
MSRCVSTGSRKVWSFCSLTAALMLGVSLAGAQESGVPAAETREKARASSGASAEPPVAYDEAIDAALHEFDLGNYAEARSRFLRAHKLFASARTLRALGMVEYELKNYGDAIERLSEALASTVKPLEGGVRAETEQLLANAKSYVARFKLELLPAGASVLLDGVPVESSPAGVVVLQVGDHQLEFRAPGRLSEKRRIKVVGGEEDTLRVALRPALEAGTRAQSVERPLRRSPWLWSAVGVVVAGAAAGTAVALTSGESRTATPYGGTSGQRLSGP